MNILLTYTSHFTKRWTATACGRKKRRRKLIREQKTNEMKHNSRSLNYISATCVKTAVNSGVECELNGAEGRSVHTVRYGLLSRA